MHRFTLALAALAAACAAQPAEHREAESSASLPALSGQTFLAGCRQGECGWLRIVRLAPAGSFAQGELRRLTARRGTSLHPDGALPETARDAEIEWQAQDRVDYAFCSLERPAYAFQSDDGAWVVHFLDLFDLAGYQFGSAGLYARVCHGSDGLPTEQRLAALGYRPGTRSEQVEAPDVAAMTTLLTR